jgi:hypothetical protein
MSVDSYRGREKNAGLRWWPDTGTDWQTDRRRKITLNFIATCMELGYNTFTLALRVVGGDKRQPSLKSESVIWFQVPRDLEPRATGKAHKYLYE